MREGRLLAEESPARLLQIFNTETLEEVFLILSRHQEEGRLDNVPGFSTLDQGNSVMDTTVNSATVNAGSTISVVSTVVSETNASTDVNSNETSLNLIYNMLFFQKLAKDLYKAKNALNKKRLSALIDKNWKQFYRNIA